MQVRSCLTWAGLLDLSLQRHPIAPRWHSKPQKSTRCQPCTDHRQREKRQQQRNTSHLVEAKIEQAQVIAATREEPPQSRSLLHTGKSKQGKPNRQRNQQVDANANSGQTWA